MPVEPSISSIGTKTKIRFTPGVTVLRRDVVAERLCGWTGTRQVSEPNDPVCWVDKLTPREFEAGFGSHTPMMSGQTKVVRYYPNFDKAFNCLKQLALERNHVFNAANKKVTFEVRPG